MAWTYTFDVTTPAGNTKISLGDDRIREMKQALRERLDNDHFWKKDESDQVSSTDAGYHRKVTLLNYDDNADVSAPTNAADTVILYCKNATDSEEASKSCLFAMDEDGNVVQLTGADGKSCDDISVEFDAAVGHRVKAGSATTGISRLHLRTDAAGFCDNVTIEIDGTNGVQIKDIATPSEGSDAYPDDMDVNPIMNSGYYTGAGADITVDAGMNIKLLIIKNTSDTDTPVMLIVSDDGTVYFETEDGQDGSGYLTLATASTFTVTNDESKVNKSGETYYWWAIGTRSAA